MIRPVPIAYEQLIKMSPQPTYRELLDTVEWKGFRKKIIERDRKCIRCNTAFEGDDGSYYRKLTAEENSQSDKEWENSPPMDLLGDGTFLVKGLRLTTLGIPLIIQVHHKYYVSG